MNDAPERIAIQIDYNGETDGVFVDTSLPFPPDFDTSNPEYIRADLHAATQAKLDKAMEALRFYADKRNWEDGGFAEGPDEGGFHTLNLINSSMDDDLGAIATRTLAELEGK